MLETAKSSGNVRFIRRRLAKHVGDAGGRAQVVFEHIDLAVGVAHQIGAGDVAPDILGRVEALARGQIALRFLDRLRAGITLSARIFWSW